MAYLASIHPWLRERTRRRSNNSVASIDRQGSHDATPIKHKSSLSLVQLMNRCFMAFLGIVLLYGIFLINIRPRTMSHNFFAVFSLSFFFCISSTLCDVLFTRTQILSLLRHTWIDRWEWIVVVTSAKWWLSDTLCYYGVM